ncbi:MAG: DUF2079 domain-containing protein [Chloroflexota bacterium]
MPNLQRHLTIQQLPKLLLWVAIVLYIIYFSWYTINRHNTLNSYAADLSLIDQPMWNSSQGPGYFMELTWGSQQQPRLAEHFEPILIPLSLLFFLWDDVRILLIAQTVALALGALPVFWIAQAQLKIDNTVENDQNSLSSLSAWAALIFAITYLLSPHLQAANIADFHADPFVVTPLLFAFWYAIQTKWRWMWVWAIIAMATKETLPTLTAMLGAYLIFDTFRRHFFLSQKFQTPVKIPLFHGLALIGISTVWFLVTTFLIVSPLAQQYFGTDGPIYFVNRYDGGLRGLIPLLQDPVRWQYVVGLFMTVGFLPLLAPELLILGLPVLTANLLSNFAGQYSGEQHYSAPLVVAFIISAIYGVKHLLNRHSLREEHLSQQVLIASCGWLLFWALGYQALHGWTPLSLRTEQYQHTARSQQIPDLLQQIPADAIVSASPGTHPHIAHRRVAYIFPTVEDADYLLLDITDISGVHPNDVHRTAVELIQTDWQIISAKAGLILAHKTSSANTVAGCAEKLPFPCAFYNFARPTLQPTYPTDLTFGSNQLKLLGYDIDDDPDDGIKIRFYWQRMGELSDVTRLWPLIYDDTGQLLSDPTQIPMITPIWYPPHLWQPNEVIITETLPQLLPDTFHIGLAVGPEESFGDTAQRLPIELVNPTTVNLYPAHWAQLGTFRRQGPLLEALPATNTLQPLTPINQQFGSIINLTGVWLSDNRLQAGDTFSILFEWDAETIPDIDYVVFIHLVDPKGQRVAQKDEPPTWLTSMPTSGWPPQQSLIARHTLSLPPGAHGAYTLQMGLYNPDTLERLLLSDGSDHVTIGGIIIR